jgi:hypothetical protein
VHRQSSAGNHPREGCRPADAIAQRRQVDDRAWVIPMGYSRQWLADTLRRLGYQRAADDALRVLPDEIDLKQLQEFGDQHGISLGEVIDRMGGSP